MNKHLRLSLFTDYKHADSESYARLERLGLGMRIIRV
jgi:hypothetical protein